MPVLSDLFGGRPATETQAPQSHSDSSDATVSAASLDSGHGEDVSHDTAHPTAFDVTPEGGDAVGAPTSMFLDDSSSAG